MDLRFAAVGGFGLMMIGVMAWDYSQYQNTQDTFQATVLGKERVCEIEVEYEVVQDIDGSERLVETQTEECTNYVHTDRETLVNDGVIWALKFNPIAENGRLVVGEKYTFKVYGHANENFGQYRTIIKAAKFIPGGGKTGGGGASNW